MLTDLSNRVEFSSHFGTDLLQLIRMLHHFSLERKEIFPASVKNTSDELGLGHIRMRQYAEAKLAAKEEKRQNAYQDTFSTHFEVNFSLEGFLVTN